MVCCSVEGNPRGDQALDGIGEEKARIALPSPQDMSFLVCCWSVGLFAELRGDACDMTALKTSLRQFLGAWLP